MPTNERNELPQPLQEALGDALAALAETGAEQRLKISKAGEARLAEMDLRIARDPLRAFNTSLSSVLSFCQKHWLGIFFGVPAGVLAVWVGIRFVKYTFPNAGDAARQDARRFGYVDDVARAGRAVEDIQGTYRRMRTDRRHPQADPYRAGHLTFDGTGAEATTPVPRRQVFHEEESV